MKETSNSTNNHLVKVAPAEIDLRERIEKRACLLWLSSGRGHGDHLRPWLLAESRVQRQLSNDALISK